MKSYKMYASSINERYVDQIVDLLRRGEVIIYPTDTLYAIGCDALNNRAVERVCRLKDINPAKQHLSIICDDISMASEYARIDNDAFRTLRANLPGPFTFILPATTRLSNAFKGRHEVGIRIPDNPIPRAIARALGNPLLSTSVDFGDIPDCAVDALVDGGDPSDSPLTPSAIVSLVDDSSSPEIIREGPKPLK